MSGIRVNLEPIRRLEEFLRYVSGRYVVFAENVTEPSRMKLDLLAATGRPFFQVTPAMRQAVLQAWRKNSKRVLSKSGTALNVDAAFREMGLAIKHHILRRFDEQGYDIELDALSPSYLEYKRRSRNPKLDTRIGIATRTLYRNLQRTKFALRKVSS